MNLSRLIILIAEDDENDVELFGVAIARTGVPHEVHFVRDGESAINWLKGDGQFSDRSKFPFPSLLITDLKMPKRSGLDVLQWLHDHEECRLVPTLVFSSSAQNEDIKRCFRLGANSYFAKPSDLTEMVRLFRSIFEYWLASQVPEFPRTGQCG